MDWNLEKWFTDNPVVLEKAITSVVFVAAIWAVRVVLVRLVAFRASKISVENRRRWLVNIRNVIIFTMIAGLIFVWASQIRSVAISLVAIAVAFVIATKELILCFSGAIYRAGTDAYGVGDCIEIDGKRGDVIDQNLFGTTIMELGPTQGSRQYTGRAIILPNSLLLSHSLGVETYMGQFVVHFITVPLTVADDWRRAEEILLRVAQQECQAFLEEARRHMLSIEKKHWFDTPSVDPRVTVFMPEAGKINMLLRIPAPSRKKGRMEQSILRSFLKEFQFADTSLQRLEAAGVSPSTPAARPAADELQK